MSGQGIFYFFSTSKLKMIFY